MGRLISWVIYERDCGFESRRFIIFLALWIIQTGTVNRLKPGSSAGSSPARATIYMKRKLCENIKELNVNSKQIWS